MNRRPNLPLRNSDGLLMIEEFLVAAMVSFVGIRSFLTLTGFPRLGGGGLHIAHVLWGGALMLGAIILLLAYLDRSTQHLAAIIGGLGFGTFVDEIGKFVTADNDYFFRPAVALVYVIFVIVFLVAQAIVGRRPLTEREALANALDLLQGTLGESVEPEDRAKIDRLLDQAGTRSELATALRRYLESAPKRPDEEAWWEAIPRRFARRYERVSADPGFERVVTVAVIAYTVAAVAGSLLLVATDRTDQSGSPSVPVLAQVLSTVGGATLVARGVVALSTSRAVAFRWFLRGVLVWLLLTQIFVFYNSQFVGLAGFAIDLIVYAVLRYAISREEFPSGHRATASH